MHDSLNTPSSEKAQEVAPPPAYDSSCRTILCPTTALNSIRYGRVVAAKSEEFKISAGSFVDAPSTIFPAFYSGWIEHIHPEGASYFVNSTLSIPVVTDSHLKNYATFIVLTEGLAAFQALAQKFTKFPPASTLYIRVENESAHECVYYLVDHTTQTEFWLEDVTTTQIGLEQVSSLEHSRLGLQEHYWTHVEYFPYRPVERELREELVGILRHGLVDHMTSRSSTFPYSIEECKGFLKILNVKDAEEAESPNHTTVVARIWSSIAKHRYDNLHGEQCARLDRGQRVREQPVECNRFLVQAVSAPLFGMNRHISAILDSLYVDGMVYTMHWRSFMGKMIDSWRDARLLAIGLMIISAVLLVQPIGRLTEYLGIAVIAVSAAAFVASIALVNRYHDAAEYTAAEAADALSNMEHPTFRFHHVALAYSIPKALITWSTILLATEVFSMIVEVSGLPLRIALIVVLGTLVLLLCFRIMVPQVTKILRRLRRGRKHSSMV